MKTELIWKYFSEESPSDDMDCMLIDTTGSLYFVYYNSEEDFFFNHESKYISFHKGKVDSFYNLFIGYRALRDTKALLWAEVIKPNIWREVK